MAVAPDDESNYFPFMKLSAELRLMIYRMALRHDGPLSLSIQRPKPTAQQEDEYPAACTTEEANISPDTAGRYASLLRAGFTTIGPQRDAVIPLSLPGSLSHAWRQTDDSEKPEAAAEEVAKEPTNLVPTILCLSRQIDREARAVLYSENIIQLELNTSIFSINSLRQPTRSLLKHVRVHINSYHDILEGFSDLVRLALRYCWGLQILTVCLPGGWSAFPNDSASDGKKGTSNVYANAFHILRWLPKTTKVILEGNPSLEIRKIVEQCGRAAQELDEAAYQKRQHQLPERA